MKKSIISIFIILAVLSASSVFAWDGTTSGLINKIGVTAEENYAFRVYLEGNPPLCGNSKTWAYLNKSSSNYESYVSVLLATKVANAQVTIYSNQDANGYCEIKYIVLY